MRYLIFAVVAGLFPAIGFAEESPRLTVTGEATVSAEPDEAYLTIGIDSKSFASDDAIKLNNVRMNELYDTLTGEFDIPKKDIKTLSFTFNKSFRKEPTGNTTKLVWDGYVANNVVRVTVRNYQDVLGRLITKVAASGATKRHDVDITLEKDTNVDNRDITPDPKKTLEEPTANPTGQLDQKSERRPNKDVEVTPEQPGLPNGKRDGEHIAVWVRSNSSVTIRNIAFGSSKAEEKLDEARALALKSAFKKAQRYASTGKFRLGRLMLVSEQQQYHAYPQAESALRDASSETPVSGGSLSYSLSVSCIWEITQEAPIGLSDRPKPVYRNPELEEQLQRAENEKVKQDTGVDLTPTPTKKAALDALIEARKKDAEKQKKD